jgi:ATP-dependent Clp protease protease subunit
MKNWYHITNKAEGPASVEIVGPIGNTWDGEGMTARQFIRDFKAISANDVTLTINSPGGSLFDGLAIYSVMAASGKNITGRVLGLAASAASLVLMACNRIEMPKNTHLMVHKGSTGAWGNADELREAADVMDTLDKSIAATYAARTGKPAEEITALLNQGDVWMTADEAVAAGFADAATDLVKVTAAFDLDKLPEAVRASLAPEPAPAPPTPAAPPQPAAWGPEALATLVEQAGLTPHMQAFAADATIVDAATATQALADAKAIKAYAQLVGKPDAANRLIRQRVSVPEARAELARALQAEDDKTLVNTAPPPGAGAVPPGPSLNVPQLWTEIMALQAGSKK